MRANQGHWAVMLFGLVLAAPSAAQEQGDGDYDLEGGCGWADQESCGTGYHVVTGWFGNKDNKHTGCKRCTDGSGSGCHGSCFAAADQKRSTLYAAIIKAAAETLKQFSNSLSPYRTLSWSIANV